MSNKKFKVVKPRNHKFTVKGNNKDTAAPFRVRKNDDAPQEDIDLHDMPQSEESQFYKSGDFSLSSIIKEVNSPSDVRLINGAVQKIVRFDITSGRIVSQTVSNSIVRQIQSFFRLGNRSMRYFLVNTSGKVSTPTLAYQIRIKEDVLILHVSSEISYSNNLNSLVEKLAISDNPATSFNAKMEGWLQEELLTERTDPIVNFFAIRNRLQRSIENKFRTLGLELRVFLKLKNEAVTEKSFDIEKNEPFNVQLKGLNELFKIRYKATISTHPTYKIYSVLKYPEIHNLPKRIARYLSNCIKSYKYSDLADGFSSNIIEDVTRILNEKMAVNREGWKIDSLVIESPEDEFQLVKHLVVKEEPSILTIRTEHSKSVQIKIFNTLVLNLHNPDLAKMMRKHTKNLEQWAKDTLSEVTHNILINATYSDLIIRQKNLELQIRNRLSEKALELGYTIFNFFTIPDIEHIKLGDPFHFNTDEDIEFDTKIGDKVKIQITVQNARIIDFEKIRSYLTPDRDIVGEMKRVIIENVRLFLQDTDPDEYYSKFEVSLREKLSQFIQGVLIESFSLDEKIEIGLRRIKTDLIYRLEKLQQGYHYFEFKNFGSLRFSSSFSVNSIDPNGGWIKFKHNNFEDIRSEVGAIKLHLKNFIESELNNKFPINFTNVKDQRFIGAIWTILRIAEQHIQEKFGLIIEVTSLKRGETSIELLSLAEANTYQENRITELEEKEKLAKKISDYRLLQYDKLQKELTKAKEEEDEKEVDRINDELKTLEEKTFKFSSSDDEVQKLETGLKNENDILDELSPPSLPPSLLFKMWTPT